MQTSAVLFLRGLLFGAAVPGYAASAGVDEIIKTIDDKFKRENWRVLDAVSFNDACLPLPADERMDRKSHARQPRAQATHHAIENSRML